MLKEMEEYLMDVTKDCGCYELGDMCYDGDGNFTHNSDEECIN